MQQQNNLNQMGHIPQDKLQGMAQGIQQNQNLPPGVYPNQPMQGNFPPTQFPPQQQQPQQRSNVAPVSDMPTLPRGPSIASGAAPVNNGNVSPMNPGGTTIAQNPAASPTDAMVNRLAEAERAVKDERRSQWLSMNQSPASSVLANLGGGELPSHLRGGNEANNPAAEIMAAGIGQTSADAPNDALLRRISEVAIRRVARKRGVAVEAPQTKLNDGLFEVNVTYVDDGRVLDTPEDLTQAFEHAIQTELALKGYDLTCAVSMFRSKDGKTEKIGAEPEEDMFACEICDGLVKDSDPTCPHCGAVFEEEEEEPETQASPTRSGPPGPKKSGGPPGPKKSGGPPGPKKSGGPPGPKKSGGPTRSEEERRSTRSEEERRSTRSEEERRSTRSEEERRSTRSKEERRSSWRSKEGRRSIRSKEERRSSWRSKEERRSPGPKKSGGPPGGPKKSGGPPGGPKRGPPR